MGAIAFIFPGQGAQYVGMGRDLAEAHPRARRRFEEAGDLLGFDLARLCFEGPEEKLKETENTQPAILTHSVAVLDLLREAGVHPAMVAGLSLGEYSALVAAGSLTFEAAVPLVRRRGRYMQEAVPLGEGTMAAVIGLETAQVEEICRTVAARRPGWVLAPANYNSPGQVVVAGHTAAVEATVEAAKEQGARMAVLLPVSAPFHCSLLEPAGARLAPDLEQAGLRDAAIPVYANVTARAVTAAAEIEALLVRQVFSPVRWEESVRAMVQAGCDTFVEVGPGRALSGFVKRIDRGVRVLNAEDAASLAKVLDSCGRVC